MYYRCIYIYIYIHLYIYTYKTGYMLGCSGRVSHSTMRPTPFRDFRPVT